MSIEDIYNYRKVDDTLITGGQPTEEQVRAAAGEGFCTVINLAPISPRYSLDDEPGLVQSLGMQYHHIPVDSGQPNRWRFQHLRSSDAGAAGRKDVHSLRGQLSRNRVLFAVCAKASGLVESPGR